ncbi:S-adenosyl-L-methionine-dependent methyltransferase [Obelidium mucronatum]|nr:S-adenosyl-L-methionine-dependent methyltransferase [Obelidium mucronatum]
MIALRRQLRPLHSSAICQGNYWDTLAKDDKPIQQTHTVHTVYSQASLAALQSPPTSARLSSRSFIHDALYNPNYGYFQKNALIFNVKEETGFAFNSIKDNLEFMNKIAHLYSDFEKRGELDETVRQVWHTPTELFKPHYGFALANYIVKEHDHSQPLKIFEIGAGNGTLARNILDFLADRFPEVYAQTEYTIIEISSKLAGAQEKRISGANRGKGDQVVVNLGNQGRRQHKAKIINQSIFDWGNVVEDPCFVVAMEVIKHPNHKKDNFSHDVVRYTQDPSGTPVQGIVLVDQDGDYQEAFEPLTDPIIKRYLDLRKSWRNGKRPPVLAHPGLRKLQQVLPFAPNLSEREFLPTMNMVKEKQLTMYNRAQIGFFFIGQLFLEKLHNNFPNHRLIVSDFDSLPDTVRGHLGPVVQTRYKGTMVACSTYLVQPGWFDIFFPTNFEDMAKMYSEIGKQVRNSSDGGGGGRIPRVLTQKDFLLENAVDLEKVRTQSGEIPMLEFYDNFKFLVS